MSRAKQRPRQLSGGHQQLVAIARAIAGRPPILLADEPTGNLDSKAGDALMQMLGELHADGATVCLATHNPRLHRPAKRHIYLFDGKLSKNPSRSRGCLATADRQLLANLETHSQETGVPTR